MKAVGDANRLFYHRTFEIPTTWSGKRTLLHFGAVDWQATVSINGKQFPTHTGGYGEFTLDITDALKPAGPQELSVSVYDPTDAGTQPRGKQVNRPGGIWYTSVTGIWQTVWLEPVRRILHLSTAWKLCRISTREPSPSPSKCLAIIQMERNNDP